MHAAVEITEAAHGGSSAGRISPRFVRSKWRVSGMQALRPNGAGARPVDGLIRA